MLAQSHNPKLNRDRAGTLRANNRNSNAFAMTGSIKGLGQSQRQKAVVDPPKPA